jgi:tripartite-type tricarboxylate transporter receptor subunit TctC
MPRQLAKIDNATRNPVFRGDERGDPLWSPPIVWEVRMFRRIAAVGGLLCLAPITAAHAADADFFKGQTLSYVVATSPGGGYDRYGRLVADYLAKKLPGVTVVIRNLPGAGHIIGANYVYASKPDGLTIGTFNTGLTMEQLTQAEGVKFDLAKMSWIGKAASDPRMLVLSAQTPEIKTIEDLYKPGAPIKVSVNGADDPEVKILEKALKLNVRLLPGYNGNDDQMAMRRGEIDANYASYSAFRSFVENGYGRFLFAVGGEVDGVPQLRDLVKAQDAETKALLNLMQAQGDIARLTAGPPAIPKDRLEVLRTAYRQVIEDPEFQEKAKQGKMPLDPAYGADVERMVIEAMTMPAETAAMVTKVVRSK